MTVDLYYSKGSAPSMVVILAAKVIGVELNLKPINVFEQEHLTPEYIKMNPQHTIPTVNNNGFAVWESRAIIKYLQNQYGKDDSLYPKDPKKRAVVDQRLYFDLDMHSRLSQVYNRQTLGGNPAGPEKVEQLNKYLEFLDTFLERSEFVAGNNLTLADLSTAVQISNMEVLKHDLSPYKNINRWISKIKTTAPGYKEYIIDEHLVVIKQLIEKFSKREV